ncbi:hypothetical protein BKI52_44060 [marine bacterium AO1-C]|nr:hypothetical protein BKI52_44060 [marine bacterium AO1-C]
MQHPPSLMINAPFKVLLVDDDPANLQYLLQLMLQKKTQYTPMTAAHGKAALEVLGEVTPDLIITDWDMPQMDGLALIRRIRQQSVLAQIPIIVITGVNTTPKNLQQAFDAGANDYITKPLNPVELYARADAALRMYQAMQTIEQQRQTIEEQKNRELSAKMLEISQKNQLLDALRRDVHNMTTEAQGKMQKQLVHLEKRIERNLNTQNEWETFKLHFEQVHPRFFDRLQQRFPKLTLIDLRHCAYLKIGLSNKEIAQILHISAPSVVKQHYRIKKKMGVLASSVLLDAVRQFA